MILKALEILGCVGIACAGLMLVVVTVTFTVSLITAQGKNNNK